MVLDRAEEEGVEAVGAAAEVFGEEQSEVGLGHHGGREAHRKIAFAPIVERLYLINEDFHVFKPSVRNAIRR